MKILTVTGYKGGVGKSVTAVHLATFFSDKGKTVLVDGDPNRTAIGWNSRGQLPFSVADERQAMRVVSGSDFVVIDTPARPNSDDLKELAKGCDLLILPTAQPGQERIGARSRVSLSSCLPRPLGRSTVFA